LIFDTSIVLQILKDRKFFEEIESILTEEIKITSVSIYELLRGATHIKIAKNSEKELNILLSMFSELSVFSFGKDDAKIASYVWAKLKERGTLINDADIMIASICIKNKERLLTLDRDFKKIEEVHSELEVEVL
jgi:Predicted nucleic acid-binding protein, contains PIN domain